MLYITYHFFVNKISKFYLLRKNIYLKFTQQNSNITYKKIFLTIRQIYNLNNPCVWSNIIKTIFKYFKNDELLEFPRGRITLFYVHSDCNRSWPKLDDFFYQSKTLLFCDRFSSSL